MNNKEAKQKIFNYVVKQASKMSARSEVNDNCLYRSLSGNRCFVGHIIPDNLYDSSMEGLNVREAFSIMGIYLNDEDYKFFAELQAIHDLYPTFEWQERFIWFADTYKLSVPDVH